MKIWSVLNQTSTKQVHSKKQAERIKMFTLTLGYVKVERVDQLLNALAEDRAGRTTSFLNLLERRVDIIAESELDPVPLEIRNEILQLFYGIDREHYQAVMIKWAGNDSA